MVSPDAKRLVMQAASAQLESLAARFRASLLRYFNRRVLTREDAEELTQEVFVRLLRQPDIDCVHNVEGFVFVTAANLLKDYYRSRSRSRTREAQSIHELDFSSSDHDPAQQAESNAEIGRLLEAIRALPPKCRAVFVMHRFDEVPHTEIARRLGITVSMVEKHIAAAMSHLRKKLKEDDNA